MKQHYTRNTVSASAWCPRCNKFTQHRIDDARVGPCLDCLARPREPQVEKPELSPQFEMFKG